MVVENPALGADRCASPPLPLVPGCLLGDLDRRLRRPGRADWSLPACARRRALEGGFLGLAAYWSVLAALVLYTASHVAEIVRGSILAVPKGQTEAANAIALSPFQRLRYVVMPQALRIAIPPIISQYLNFTKNTSLAIAIGYAEITRITFQMIGNGQPAPQMIASSSWGCTSSSPGASR